MKATLPWWNALTANLLSIKGKSLHTEIRAAKANLPGFLFEAFRPAAPFSIAAG